MNTVDAQAKQKILLDVLEKGQEEQRKGNFQVAEAIYHAALNDNPHDLNALFLFATSQQSQGKNGLAIALYSRLIQNLPNVPAIYNNLGGCYHQENFNKEAFESYSMALRLAPDDIDVLSNLGGMFVNTGSPEDGEPYFKKLFELKPDHNHAKWNYSLLCLEQEKFGIGFDYYDKGFETKDRKYKDYGLPEWEGQECDSIVVCGEQGIGDEIMFSSLLHDLSKKVKRIVYDCHPRLLEVMAHHSLVDEIGKDRFLVHPSRKESDVEWVKEFNCQYRVNIGSLGRFFRRDPADFNSSVRNGYLRPDAKKVTYWYNKMRQHGPGPIVGLSWFGGNKRTRADMRSVALPYLMPLLDTPGVTWICSQYNVKPDMVESFEKSFGIKIHYMLPDDDFYEWTMMNCACDFHVSVCNSLVHMMGAYGREIYCLTPKAVAWRYGLVGEKMIWYNSPVLIRQQRENDWGYPVSRMMEILTSKMKKVA